MMIDQLAEESLPRKGAHLSSGSLLLQRFQVIRLLGTGGMGHVYLAEDLQLSRFVAIKTIRPDLFANEEIKKRIAHECRMHAAIGVHPNIVALYDRLEENGNVYLIMEYVEGVLLSELLASQGTLLASLKVVDLLDIILQLLEGLSAIHQKDIIHRDIKPANIIIRNQSSRKFDVKLMDFGIARAEIEDSQITRLTMLDANGPGTPIYMAPERIDQKLFGNLCAATDLYSVGVILFQMLSDGPPFRGTMTEIFIGHLTRPPDLTLLKVDIPQRLRAVLEKALQKKTTERYSDAKHFIHDILQVSELNRSSSHEEVNVDKTLLATDFSLKAVHNEATCLATNTVNIGSLKKNRKNKILAILGILVLSFIVVFLIFPRGKNNTSTETLPIDSGKQPVEEQASLDKVPESVEQRPKEIEAEPVTIQQSQQFDKDIDHNVNKSDPAIKAFELAKKQQAAEVAAENVGGVEQRKPVTPINSVRSDSSAQRNRGAGGNAKCQSLLRNFKLGDSSTIQQYQKECAN